MRLTMFGCACALGLGCIAAEAAADVSAARALWEAQAAQSYRYGYNKYCECNRERPPETVVTVERGAVVEVHHVHEGSSREVPARDGSLDLYWTVDGLFALVAAAMERSAVVRADYDETLGYPKRIFIDYDEGFIGDELDLRLTYVEILE